MSDRATRTKANIWEDLDDANKAATEEKQDTIVSALANIEASETTVISHLANVVSTVNSTSTPLGISGVFTGTAEDVTKYAAVSVTVKSDRASATNGLSIQFSTDGTNWDNVDTHTISAGVSHTTTNAVQSKFFRVVYTNEGTAQTYFRLQVLYATEAVGPVIEEMGGDVSDTTSTLTTKAVLFAKNPAGVYGSINRTTGGNLKVSIEESVAPATLLSGRKTVATAGTAEALGAGAIQGGVLVMALKTNTNNVFVGNSTVDKTTDKQTELEPGESYAFAVDNLSKIWVDVTTNNDGVSYAGS